jgi:hypothetical protein
MERLLQKLGLELNITQELDNAKKAMTEIQTRIFYLTSLSEFVKRFERLTDFGKEQFLALANVKGCKPFHLEGNALVHTLMVFREMYKLTKDMTMLDAAFLHDIGKVYTGRPRKDDPSSWEYPNHSGKGAEVVDKFVDYPECISFQINILQWIIGNHIRPLFWMKKGTIEVSPIPTFDIAYYNQLASERCTVPKLALLALCDIRGSVSSEPQKELERFLLTIADSEINQPGLKKRRVVGMKNNIFEVQIVDVRPYSDHDYIQTVYVPVEEYIAFVLDHDWSLPSLSKNDSSLIINALI